MSQIKISVEVLRHGGTAHSVSIHLTSSSKPHKKLSRIFRPALRNKEGNLCRHRSSVSFKDSKSLLKAVIKGVL